MAATKLIKQGESLPFCFDRSGETIANWVCTIFVKQYPGDTAFISRVVAPEGDAWPGFLTSTETAALPPSSKTPYLLIGKLTNASEDRESQIPNRFNVATALA